MVYSRLFASVWDLIRNNQLQPAKAAPYGKLVSSEAQAANPNWGALVSPLAQNADGQGIGDHRANGLRVCCSNGQGTPNPGGP